MARIPLGALTTLNLSTHLDPMFTELYTAAGGDFSSAATVTVGNGTGQRQLVINGGTAAPAGPAIIMTRNAAEVFAVGASDRLFGTGGSDTIFYTYGAQSQRFYTNTVERMRITSSGHVGIGGTSFPLAAANRGLITLNGANDTILNFTVNGASIGYVGGSAVATELAGESTVRLVTNGGIRMSVSVGGTISPGIDNAQPFGAPSLRWSVIYSATGAINTSDAREKTKVAKLTPGEISAAQQLGREIGAYKFLSAVKEKGDAARIHIGLTVQRAIEIMEDNGLEPMAYAFICHDKWEEEEGRPAGDRYGFRMDELMAFVCAGQQAAHDLLEARLSKLEGSA